ncbi:FecR family protein [Aerosakkonema funiforme]|uniref:FecR domain-containing protein n=1 Tax=Aerosakkonema funiforme FACHB-1375 TaxID=2949571 RepID=A0A926ZLP5_9CYAN|nr:FecR family protein [Aerosakkonema funiforme]MBD2185271.1 FecR domain-containing protein [Aerosakkonema funiforme FACHB-1375]
MSRKLVLLLSLILWSIMTLPLPKEVSAEMPLSKAVIQSIRNLVRLIPQNQTGRPARVSEPMNPGDSLATGRESLAELRFNDGSLARVGEQAVFQFLPNTRTFKLSDGTALLLIAPGRGRTQLQTPNARTGIRGSALFVRYNRKTDTTIVGALTNSNIEVFNQDASQAEVLRAGQLAVIVKDRIERIYDFDIRTFYETSDLVRGLNLTQPGDKANPDSAMADVQSETSAAVTEQTPIVGQGVIENPNFIQLDAASSNLPNVGAGNDNQLDTGQSDRNFGQSIGPNPFSGNPGLENPPLEGGQILSDPENSPDRSQPPTDDGLPNTPGNPSNPDNAGNPGNPSNPDNAGNPGNPSNPDNAGNPGNPSNPDNAGNPGNPSNPDNAGNPGNPSNPDNSGNPGNPGNGGDNGPPSNPGNSDNGPPGPEGNPGNGGDNGPPSNPGNSGNGPPGPEGNPGNGGDNGPPSNPGNSGNGPPGPEGNPGNSRGL